MKDAYVRSDTLHTTIKQHRTCQAHPVATTIRPCDTATTLCQPVVCTSSNKRTRYVTSPRGVRKRRQLVGKNSTDVKKLREHCVELCQRHGCASAQFTPIILSLCTRLPIMRSPFAYKALATRKETCGRERELGWTGLLATYVQQRMAYRLQRHKTFAMALRN